MSVAVEGVPFSRDEGEPITSTQERVLALAKSVREEGAITPTQIEGQTTDNITTTSPVTSTVTSTAEGTPSASDIDSVQPRPELDRLAWELEYGGRSIHYVRSMKEKRSIQEALQQVDPNVVPSNDADTADTDADTDELFPPIPIEKEKSQESNEKPAPLKKKTKPVKKSTPVDTDDDVASVTDAAPTAVVAEPAKTKSGRVDLAAQLEAISAIEREALEYGGRSVVHFDEELYGGRSFSRWKPPRLEVKVAPAPKLPAHVRFANWIKKKLKKDEK